jgi:sugar lactone lactonase YvrE
MRKPRIRPQRWNPPKSSGLTGPFAPNNYCAPLTRIDVSGVGPEDIAFDQRGTAYTGVSDGRILSRAPKDESWKVIAHTNGRPLGIEVSAQGALIVCDAVRGLLQVDPESGAVELLADECDSEPLIVTNNASIASDGTIYFSQSTRRFGLEHLKADLLEHSTTGRLMRRLPDGTVEVLIDHLNFANGVCLAADESFVLVAETSAYSIRKYWLSGERAGTNEILIDNLPGFPDNISLGTQGFFWVAMPSERNALLDVLLPRPGFLRSIVWALPDAVQPEASRITFVLGIDGDGRVVANLQGDGRDFHYVTGVREHEGHLYLGSLVEEAIGVIPVPS